MGALVATDVAVTLSVRDRDVGRGAIMKNLVFPTITFGNGALTYPSGGIPLPAIGMFGIQRQIDFGAIEQPPGDGYLYKFDRANHKLLIYISAGFTPAGGVAAPVFTGGAMAAHVHDLKFIEGTGGDALGIDATNVELETVTTGGKTIVGANSATKGGVVEIGAGTPAGTNDTPAFTGTPVAAGALVEAATSLAPAATSIKLMLVGE